MNLLQVFVLAFCVFICQECSSYPVAQQESQTFSPETQILGPVVDTSSALLSSESQGKAGPSPIDPQNLSGVVPAPIKDRIPGVLSSVGNSSDMPTLFIGGFSILQIPMKNGLSDMQQFLQVAPNIMSMAPMAG